LQGLLGILRHFPLQLTLFERFPRRREPFAKVFLQVCQLLLLLLGQLLPRFASDEFLVTLEDRLGFLVTCLREAEEVARQDLIDSPTPDTLDRLRRLDG